MNAQFYADRFQQAAAEFARVANLVRPPDWEQRLTLRFHGEAQAEQPLVIESALIEDYPQGYAIGHRLLAASSGQLLASTIDRSPWQPQNLSIPSRPFEPRFDNPGENPNADAPKTEEDALRAGGFASGGITIGPADVDAAGHCLNRLHVGLFGDGAAIAWQVMELSRDVLQSHRWGCMVVNLSMVILSSLKPGIAVKQVSRIVKLRSRTVTLRHDQFNVVTGEPIARSLATGLLVSLDTRRAIAFPPEINLNKYEYLPE
ncbi:MAG: thioesterase family protein [Cyanobacteria bacterium P01_D01_bin.44]